MIGFIALAAALCLCSWALLARPTWRRPRQDAPAADRPSRRLSIGLALLLAGVSAGGYALIGSPESLHLRPGVPTTPTEQVAAMLQKLEARVKRQPDDAAAWGELARANVAVGRHQDGLAAFEQAVKLRPDDAGLLADYADVLAVRNGRSLAGEPERLIARALRADPKHLKALTLSGMVALGRRDYAAALAHWQTALDLAPPDDPLVAQLRASMARARQQAASSPAASTP